MIWKRRLTGEALRARAEKLGVRMVLDEYENQRRVMEAERHIREHRLWIVAVVSMLISVISTATAWWVVLHPAPKIDCPQLPPIGKAIEK
jgi:hypothetical protein